MTQQFTRLERLQQEHAIYKAFFDSYWNRIPYDADLTQLHPLEALKLSAFDVLQRLKRLDTGFIYYDPVWADADKVLFPITPESIKDKVVDGRAAIRKDVID